MVMLLPINCDCIIIEVANYDASVIRKALFHYTIEMSQVLDIEKSLDSEMTLLALEGACIY